MVETAKKEGIRVTAEVCPHHFILTSSDIKEDDANYKMNPPLRTSEDVEALREGLKADIMDVISTDHAPHTAIDKGLGMKKAPSAKRGDAFIIIGCSGAPGAPWWAFRLKGG